MAAAVWRRGWLSPPARQWLIIVGIALVAGCYFHTRLLLWNNPRYVLPLFVFLLAAFVIALSQAHGRFRRWAVAIVILVVPLMIVSHHRTVDPLSKWTFGTIQFGDHDLLKMGGIRRLPAHGRLTYYGRDQLVYNLEFMKFGELAEAAVRKFGLDAHYRTGPVFTGWTDFQGFDAQTLARSMRPDARQIDFLPIEQATDGYPDAPLESVVFLAFPNVMNEDTLKLLQQRYESRLEQMLSVGGYSIRAYEFRGPKSAVATVSGAAVTGLKSVGPSAQQ
jgi:hypothetical protein